jgi:CheY-like chemotaxis protein
MPTKPLDIVVVDDEPDTAEMFAEMVRLLDYRVFKSYSGFKAMDLIADRRPAAVLLDVMMPDFSGLDVLQFMRRDPRLAEIPVIIISAKGLPSDVRKGLDAGASLYLTKPVSFDDLRTAIEKAIVKQV